MIYRHEQQERKLKLAWDGYRPSMPRVRPELWPQFDSYLLWRHCEPELAKASGWYPAKYKEVPRVIIPCSNREGVPYFQGRDMTETHELRYASPPVPRDDSLCIVWPEDSKPRFGGVILEGPLDALAAAGEGFVGVSLMGNMPTDEVLQHLLTFARAFQPIYVVPDADALDAGARLFASLAQHGLDVKLKTPAYKDLAAMSPKQRGDVLHV